MKSLENIYVLSGTLEAINLFLDSLETLKKHNTYDFMVYTFNKESLNIALEKEMKEMQSWETSVLIDEQSYRDLYSNLCQKLRKWSNTK